MSTDLAAGAAAAGRGASTVPSPPVTPALRFVHGVLWLDSPWGEPAAGVLRIDGAAVVAPWGPDADGDPTCQHGPWRLRVEQPLEGGCALVLENTSAHAAHLGMVHFGSWAPERFRPRLATAEYRELIHGGSFEHVQCAAKCVGRPAPEVEAVAPSSLFTVYQREEDQALLLGVLPPMTAAFAEFLTLHAEPHLEGDFGMEARFLFDCDVPPGNRCRTAPLVALAGRGGTDLMRRYGQLWAARRTRRTRRPPIVGWNSWDHYSGAVTRQVMDQNLEAAGQLLPGALHTLIIDEGWEAQWGTWEPNAKFPGGLEDYCRHVAAQGWTPGIWTAPLLVNTYNPLYLEHPDWCARRADGEPQIDTYAYGPMAYLDPTVPEVIEFLDALFRRLRRAGFGYFKVDFSHCILKARRFRDPTVGRNHLIRRAFAAIRQAIGPDAYLLSCGSPYESVVDLVDGVRLTGDIHIFWGHVLRSADALAARWWMQGTVWNGDPDFLVVRGPQTAHPPFGRRQEVKPLGAGRGWCAGRPFTAMEARTWALLVHLSGGDVVLSDPLRQLRPEGLEIVQRVLAPRIPAAEPVDLFTTEQDLPRVWLSRGARDVLVGVFNWSDRTVATGFDPSEWGLHGVPHDFWSGAERPQLPTRMPRRSHLALIYPVDGRTT